MDLKTVAQENFARLNGNPYPGRGIIVGLSEDGQRHVQVYWIMGRSENSRNRVFKSDEDTGRVWTERADPKKVKDPSLIIYDAMREFSKSTGRTAVVSNGGQTNVVALAMAHDSPMIEVLAGYDYEPDAPNFTPRITAHSTWRFHGPGHYHPITEIALLRKSLASGACDRNLYMYADLLPGMGHCITTYTGDGDPLPSFMGEPYLLPLKGDAGQIAHTYANLLNQENLVAVVVKSIPVTAPSEIVIVNTRTQVPAPVAA